MTRRHGGTVTCRRGGAMALPGWCARWGSGRSDAPAIVERSGGIERFGRVRGGADKVGRGWSPGGRRTAVGRAHEKARDRPAMRCRRRSGTPMALHQTAAADAPTPVASDEGLDVTTTDPAAGTNGAATHDRLPGTETGRPANNTAIRATSRLSSPAPFARPPCSDCVSLVDSSSRLLGCRPPPPQCRASSPAPTSSSPRS